MLRRQEGGARVGPETSAVRKRRRAGSVTDDEAPMVGPGGCELVGGVRLDLAGASEARVSGGKGGVRGVAASSEARARRVAERRQTSGQGQGDQKPPAKKARGHAAGAGREVRSGMDPGD